MSPNRAAALILPFALCSCLFDGGTAPDAPLTHFDFSRLDSLENPFARWYPIDRNENLAGVKFAFTSIDYAHQVDSNIAAFTAEIGRQPAIAGAYFDLSSQPKNLKTFLDAVAANGCIPFVTLDPKDWDEPDIAFQRTFINLIRTGHFDDTLKALARTFKEFGKPALFRFAHEMNGDWYPYSGAFLGAGADTNGNGVADGPENYISAWRHVHDLFSSEGADKLVWVFCPNAETFPPEAWNAPFAYYPGSDYVDVISVDSYESPDKKERGLEEVLEVFSNEMGLFFESRAGEPGSGLKPFGLAEFGTYRKDGTAKAGWYASALSYISAEESIKFNILYNARNYDKDFSITGIGLRLRDAYAAARFRFGPIDP